MGCNYSIFLDSGFRRNDGYGAFLTFYEFIKDYERKILKLDGVRI